MIYFHKPNAGWFSDNAPIKTLKAALINTAHYLRHFRGIYCSKYQLNGYFDACNNKLFHKNLELHFHEDIVHYLMTIDSDPQYCVKTISSLPKAITEQYYEERNRQGYEIPLNQGHLTTTAALKQPTVLTDGEVNKFELIGMPLNSFPTVQINYSETYSEVIPKVIFLLTTFFMVNQKHLDQEGLFRVNGNRQKIEELSVHL